MAASTGIGHQQLNDYYDSEYIGTIAVGTPPVVSSTQILLNIFVNYIFRIMPY
jgi:hypothetical protein